MKCILLPLTMILILSTPFVAQADVATFAVDFSGAAESSGHALRVVGFITLDPDLSVGSAIQASNLQFEHQSDDPDFLPSIPIQSTDDPSTGLDWVLTGNELFIVRTSNDNRFIRWVDDTSPDEPSLTLGSGVLDHSLRFGTLDFLELKGPSGPDGPAGFLVGTKIPEPSSFLLFLGLVCFPSLARSKRELQGR